MSSISSSVDCTIKMNNDHLQIGEISIKADTATNCWPTQSNNTVTVVCQSNIGSSYKATGAINCLTQEKTKECFQLLVAQTKTKFNFHNLTSIKPSSAEVTLLSFVQMKMLKNFGCSMDLAFLQRASLSISSMAIGAP